MAPDRLSHFHTMSSPNTNALMSLFSDAVKSNRKPSAAGFKIVYVGKDKTPLNILDMAPIDGDVWKKSASFESLSSTIRGQMEAHSSVDLISIISQEMPIDVTAAYMESTKIKNSMMSSMTDIGSLSGISFLLGDGSKAQSLVSCADKDRIEDLSYIKIGCYLDGTTVDNRISLPGLDLQYCLKLPQSSYDPGTSNITAFSTPGTLAKISPNSPVKKLFFGPPGNNASDDDDSVSPPKQDSTPQAVTPKMSRLFNSPSSGSTITSYFGPMTFLNDQKEFDRIFGVNPIILGANPITESSSDCLKKSSSTR